jgi:hypothetical protein
VTGEVILDDLHLQVAGLVGLDVHLLNPKRKRRGGYYKG